MHNRSEFAGLALEEQREKVRKGVAVFQEHGIVPRVFFAPGHTFDRNTLKALALESDIRVICDTIAKDVYYQDGFYL